MKWLVVLALLACGCQKKAVDPFWDWFSGQQASLQTEGRIDPEQASIEIAEDPPPARAARRVG